MARRVFKVAKTLPWSLTQGDLAENVAELDVDLTEAHHPIVVHIQQLKSPGTDLNCCNAQHKQPM